MSGQNPREIAAEVLARCYGTAPNRALFVEEALDQALTRTPLAGPDRGLCQELVYGVVRWQSTLDWLISRKTSHPPDKPLLLHLLRLGLYQIFWLSRIPNHAAVNESVEIAKRKGLKTQAGFINAVLRGFLREFDSTQAALKDLRTSNPALGFSHPEWLVQRWQARWPSADVVKLLEWDNSPARTFARVNTLKTESAKLIEQWRAEGVEYDFTGNHWVEDNAVFVLKSHPPLQRLNSFRQGLFYIQDPSTLLSVRELGAKSAEKILDLCAAPGGKTTFIAQQMQDKGEIVAHDTSAERLKLVQENCARLGVTCVRPVGPDYLETHPASSFDRVLIDAPCSNTGVIKRRVDLRWRIKSEEIERLRVVQLDLLTRAASLLKRGGTLVYSTCSLEPEENEQVVTQFLTNSPWFKPESQRQLFPFRDQVDGAFVAKFVKG